MNRKLLLGVALLLAAGGWYMFGQQRRRRRWPPRRPCPWASARWAVSSRLAHPPAQPAGRHGRNAPRTPAGERGRRGARRPAPRRIRRYRHQGRRGGAGRAWPSSARRWPARAGRPRLRGRGAARPHRQHHRAGGDRPARGDARIAWCPPAPARAAAERNRFVMFRLSAERQQAEADLVTLSTPGRRMCCSRRPRRGGRGDAGEGAGRCTSLARPRADRRPSCASSPGPATRWAMA